MRSNLFINGEKMVQRKHWFVLIILLGSLWLRTPFVQAKPNLQAQDQPVVRVLMFWSTTCGHCEYVINEIFPPLQAQYGEQLEILLIELVTQDDVDNLFQTADAFGIPKENVGVPFLIIDEQVLTGSQQIPMELPGLIEMHLATGGVDFPDLPFLAAYLPGPAEGNTGGSADNPQTNQSATLGSNGFTLAIVVLVGMVISLIYTVIAMWKREKKDRPAWIDLLTPLLVAVGFMIAGYLSYVETQAVEAVCGPIGDCNTVQSSSYASLFGVLPVGILGMVGYTAILIAWLIQRLRNDKLADYASLALLGLGLFGTLFSIYLTYLEIFVIEAVCLWCISSAVIMTSIMLLSIRPAQDVLVTKERGTRKRRSRKTKSKAAGD